MNDKRQNVLGLQTLENKGNITIVSLSITCKTLFFNVKLERSQKMMVVLSFHTGGLWLC